MRSRSAQERLIVLGVFLLGVGLYFWQFSVPEFPNYFYDTGVYLGAAIHLTQGIMPYRDFTFVQPPGILLLMSPVAFFSHVVGSHDGFILARAVSACVTAMNAGLVAWLIRSRGRIGMLVAGVGLAVLPVAMLDSVGVRLDPFCILFVLLGSVVIFSGIAKTEEGEPLAKRVLVVGGILFGIAAAIKLWAFFPFVAVVICLTPRYRVRIVAFVASAGAALVAICLPFIIAAPHNFFSEVVMEQLFRQANAADSASFIGRLTTLTGFADTSLRPSGTQVLIAIDLFVILVAVAFLRRLERETVDAYVLTSAAITSVGLLTAPETYTYYGYFSAPFLLALLGISIGRLTGPIGRRLSVISMSLSLRRTLTGLTALIGVLATTGMVLFVTSFYTVYSWAFGYYAPYLAPITAEIPAGSCVVYN